MNRAGWNWASAENDLVPAALWKSETRKATSLGDVRVFSRMKGRVATCPTGASRPRETRCGNGDRVDSPIGDAAAGLVLPCPARNCSTQRALRARFSSKTFIM